jgi:hypothetical protein
MLDGGQRIRDDFQQLHGTFLDPQMNRIDAVRGQHSVSRSRSRVAIRAKAKDYNRTATSIGIAGAVVLCHDEVSPGFL